MPIRVTRYGFWYQDLCAVHLFLEAYLQRSVGAVFVDFEYDGAGQKSFDVRIAGRSGASKNFEIKTGNHFKTRPELIADAFVDLIKALQFGHVTAGSQACLLISPTFEAQIARYHEQLLYIRSHSIRAPGTRTALTAYTQVLPAGLCADEQELYDHLNQIDLVPGHRGEVSDGESVCPLEQVIVGQIRSLAGRIGIRVPNSPLFPEDVLLQQLVYAAYTGAGTNQDLLPEFRRLMADFYARYNLSTPSITAGAGGTIDLSQEDFTQRLAEFEDPEANADQSADNTGSEVPNE